MAKEADASPRRFAALRNIFFMKRGRKSPSVKLNIEEEEEVVDDVEEGVVCV